MNKLILRAVICTALAYSLAASAARPLNPPQSPQEYAQRLNKVLLELAALSVAYEKSVSGPAARQKLVIACGCPEGPTPNPSGGPPRPPEPPGPVGLDAEVMNSAQLAKSFELVAAVKSTISAGGTVEIVRQAK